MRTLMLIWSFSLTQFLSATSINAFMESQVLIPEYARYQIRINLIGEEQYEVQTEYSDGALISLFSNCTPNNDEDIFTLKCSNNDEEIEVFEQKNEESTYFIAMWQKGENMELFGGAKPDSFTSVILPQAAPHELEITKSDHYSMRILGLTSFIVDTFSSCTVFETSCEKLEIECAQEDNPSATLSLRASANESCNAWNIEALYTNNALPITFIGTMEMI